jgi:hypothetical protein
LIWLVWGLTITVERLQNEDEKEFGKIFKEKKRLAKEEKEKEAQRRREGNRGSRFQEDFD